MKTRLSATEAARSFSDIINRVRYRGEEFIVERGGEPVCHIEPIAPFGATVADLVELLRTLPAPDRRYADDLEALTRSQPSLPGSPWER